MTVCQLVFLLFTAGNDMHIIKHYEILDCGLCISLNTVIKKYNFIVGLIAAEQND